MRLLVTRKSTHTMSKDPHRRVSGRGDASIAYLSTADAVTLPSVSPK